MPRITAKLSKQEKLTHAIIGPQQMENIDVSGAEYSSEDMIRHNKQHKLIFNTTGPQYKGAAHDTSDNSSGVARVDASVRDLERLEKAGSPTPISGDDLAIFGPARMGRDYDEVGGELTHNYEEYRHMPAGREKRKFKEFVDRQVAFHNDMHNTYKSQGNTCGMCGQ